MSAPHISIIMAAKDTAPYLQDCLDSILAQTYAGWELIAINDHSTDRTAEILSAYANKDPRVRLVHSKRHKLIPALKEGYRHARGALINRMDSDDKMPAYKLEVLVKEWERWGKGTVVAGGTEHFVEEGEVGEGFLRYERWLNEVARKNQHYREIYKECVIPSHCWIIHRDDFEAVGGFEPEVYPEDYDLCFRFYKNGLKVVGLDKILHYWRDRSNRISRTWEEYKDNRYFEMKLRYFLDIDRDAKRPLVLWGAGKNGKDMAKRLQSRKEEFYWVCNNEKKIGKNIYGVELKSDEFIFSLSKPQIMIVVAAPGEKAKMRQQLEVCNKKPVEDYWFFL